MAKEYKYKVSKSFIDFNGHLAEFGYYYYGVDGLRKLCEDKGCSPELYEKLKIGPITFQTTVSFKKRSLGELNDYRKSKDYINVRRLQKVV